ncbi:MAG: iron-sulfur cluster insertion protein ErpA [Actinobacteria bacterium]|jgi:iron-sulfur cluster assembly accessory protein|nr:iron-sulfur cluster insertion protein ErpA [Actinomycetota bacterium]MTA10938.1 iron-sulfur cluster insertion protein ErpA [Actinomycetota bacterium]MTA69790.1 iron-sulfur cluster insertion protein ErpA [Actinomycetota bacterium]
MTLLKNTGIVYSPVRKHRSGQPVVTNSRRLIVITLTDTAAVKVKELLQAEGADDMALRVAVRPGGCSGFSYEMFFDSDIAADDEQANYGEDVRVVVDPASAQLLVGATLDYKDGLNQAGFNIINPNATRSCGCGQSFS